MLRIIREQEPLTPSTRISQMQTQNGTAVMRKSHVPASTLKGELDWIVMKAIEKDRSRRYESASAFAADIGRYLANEPVQAAAPSTLYLFGKFARRHKVALGTAAAMLALLLAGIATTARQAARAVAAEKLAARGQAEAESFANVLREVLEGQLTGYWQPDMSKNRNVNPLEALFMGRMIFEFQKGTMTIHGPPGNTAEKQLYRFTIKQPEQAGKALVMEFIQNGDAGKISGVIEGDTLTLSMNNDTFILSRISDEEFKAFAKLNEEAKAAAISEKENEPKVPPVDIAAIDGLKDLEKIEFYNKRVINIGSLAGLPKLKDLSIYMSNFPTLDFLESTTAIERLNLFGSDHTFKDYKPLLHLKNLRELDLTANPQATDANLRELAALTTLEKFSMGLCTEVTSLDFLRNCKGLREIHVGACHALRDVDVLAGFTDLEVLDLSSTPLSDIGFLKNAKKLRELDLSDAQVTDLSPLLPLMRSGGLRIALPDGLGEEQRRAVAEATTLSPEEMKRIAPTGLTLVVCDANDKVLDTLVVQPDVESAEYEFRIPEGQGEIRVFVVGSRIEKTEFYEEITQNCFVARPQNKTHTGIGASLGESVGVTVGDGKLNGFNMAGIFASEPRSLKLTETLRNQIHADIVANQRTMPIFLVETTDNIGGRLTVTHKPVE
jgi:Leucine-rich repeat (LRR) protein